MRSLNKALWMIRFEYLLVTRGQTAAFGKFAPFVSPIFFGFLYLIFHVALLTTLQLPEDFIGKKSVEVGVFLAIVVLLMTSIIATALEVTASAPSLVLILSSPFPTRTYLLARIYALSLKSILLPLLLISPFYNVVAISGHPSALFVFPFILFMSITASSTVIAVMVFFQSKMKANAFRYGITIVGLLILGYVFLLMGQSRYVAQFERLYNGTIGNALAFAGSAATGARLPLILSGLIALISAQISARCTAIAFERLSSSTSRSSPISLTGKEISSFSRSWFFIVFKKELRLLSRNPGLFVQSLRFVIAVGITLTYFSRNGANIVFIGASLMLICNFLSNDISWMMAGGEDAQDLIESAPVNQKNLRYYQILTAVIPPAFVLVIGTFAIFRIDKFFSIICFFISMISIACSVAFNFSSSHVTRGSLSGISKNNRQPPLTIFFQAGIILVTLVTFYLCHAYR